MNVACGVLQGGWATRSQRWKTTSLLLSEIETGRIYSVAVPFLLAGTRLTFPLVLGRETKILSRYTQSGGSEENFGETHSMELQVFLPRLHSDFRFKTFQWKRALRMKKSSCCRIAWKMPGQIILAWRKSFCSRPKRCRRYLFAFWSVWKRRAQRKQLDGQVDGDRTSEERSYVSDHPVESVFCSAERVDACQETKDGKPIDVNRFAWLERVLLERGSRLIEYQTRRVASIPRGSCCRSRALRLRQFNQLPCCAPAPLRERRALSN